MIIFVVVHVVAFGNTYVLHSHLTSKCTAVSRYTSHKELFVVEFYMLRYEIKCPRILPNLVILPSGGRMVAAVGGSLVFSLCSLTKTPYSCIPQ